MKKITLLFALLTFSLGYSQNLFTDGTFDDPSAWTVIQQNGNNNATAVVAGGVATFDVVDGTATWGAEGHVAIYKTFTVATTGWYEFDAITTTNGVSEHWFEVHVGTAAPVDGVEYNATKILTLHHWDCGATTNTYSGSMIATGCQGLDGKIQLDAGTTYYYLVRTGGITWGTGGVIMDDITMVAIAASETCSDGILNNSETEIDCGGPNCAACPSEPTDAPAAPPTFAAEDVISLYGDAHGTAVGLNGVPWDGGSESVEGSYAGNNALLITNGTNDFIGFDVADAAGFVDATNMSHVHVDFWLDTDYVAGQVVKAKLSNHALLAGETSSIIVEAFPTATDVRTWYSLDLPLGAGDREKVAQVLLIYTHSAGAPANLYVDNFYFYNDGSLSTKDFKIAGLNAYPNPSQDNWTVNTQNIRMSSIKVYDILGKNVLSLKPNKTETVIDGSSLKAGLYFAQIKTETGVSSIKLIKD